MPRTTNGNTTSTDTRPWYRQFWVWFVIALPASAVVAGLSTVYIAYKYKDDLVVDNYYQQGLGINRDLDEDRKAANLGIRVVMENHGGAGWIHLSSKGDTVAPEGLRLSLRHPTIAARDQLLHLVSQGHGLYRSPVTLPDGTWDMTLQPNTGNWRIGRRITLGITPQLALDATQQ